MRLKRLMQASALALLSGTVLAQDPPSDVWITLGSDAVGPVRDAFAKAGRAAPLATFEAARGAVVVHLEEEELALVSRVMHERFRRCPGFAVHESREEATAALTDPDVAVAVEAAFLDYTVDNGPVARALINGLSASNIVQTINGLSSFATRFYTHQTGEAAANWLRDRWAGYASGRPEVTVELFRHSGWRQPSVILTIPGTTLPQEVVVIGGHLDSVNRQSTTPAPGADDDASGIASFTEVIRVALASGYRPLRTVKFMGYAAEEVGLRGSNEIATSFRNAGTNVVGVLQLDMTNFKGSTVDIGIVTDNTNALQNDFLRTLITTYVSGVTFANTQCGYACSDHASWTRAGYPASIPFESLVGQHNSRIHTANDTLNNSDRTGAHALKFARVAAAYVAEVAKGTLGSAPPPSPTPPPPPPPGGALTATFDPALRAPRCAPVGTSCDSGTLLTGRDGRGPEPNQPNTIGGSCADGTSGTFHADESNDRIRVATVDGQPFAAGKTVRIEATVWAWTTPSADRLDLYRAANANSPSWVHVATLTPAAARGQTLSATYTLPSGSLQAVRARFRYQGSATACGTGSFIDHDDLVFAVR